MAINYIVVRTNPGYQFDEVINTINNNFSSVTTSFLYATGGTISGDLIVNGSISGVTLYGDGSNLTGISGGSGYNYYTTGGTLIGTVIYFDRNDQLSAYTIQLSGLTSGITFSGNYLPLSGGTVTGSTDFTTQLLSGGTDLYNIFTDKFTTGGTLIGTSVYFDRNNLASAYSIELSGLTSGITFSGDYLPLSGGTVTGSTNFTAQILSGGTDLYNIFVDKFTTGGTLIGTSVYFDRSDQLSAYTIQLSGLTSGITFSGNYLPLSGGTVTGNSSFDYLSAITLSATTIFSAGTNIENIFVQPNNTQTLTNKRITKRVVNVTASATPTINTDSGDIFSMTGLSVNMTNASTNLTGNPVHGDLISIEITDNGVARSLSWGSSFAASGTISLPTVTIISTMRKVLFQYNSASNLWVITAVV